LASLQLLWPGALIAVITEQQRKIEFLSSQRVSPTPTVAPRAEPEARNLPSTATEAFHLQSECVEMGKRVLEANLAYAMAKIDMQQGKVPRYDVTQRAHYNPKDNHCYVALEGRDLGIEKAKRTEWRREVYDGQTGELLAAYWVENPPFGKRFGTIFKLERVPASALPAQLPFSKEHEHA
jgi:hypothetical protein